MPRVARNFQVTGNLPLRDSKLRDSARTQAIDIALHYGSTMEHKDTPIRLIAYADDNGKIYITVSHGLTPVYKVVIDDSKSSEEETGEKTEGDKQAT